VLDRVLDQLGGEQQRRFDQVGQPPAGHQFAQALPCGGTRLGSKRELEDARLQIGGCGRRLRFRDDLERAALIRSITG
jgi:hypothetical protein